MIRDSIEVWVIGRHRCGPRVLLLHVPPCDPGHAGFLQPVTGGVEPGESHVDAAVREVREETGLRIHPDALHLVIDDFRVPITPALTMRKRVFGVAVHAGHIRVAPHEHDGYRWMSPEQVDCALGWESNRTTWQRVRTMMRGFPPPVRTTHPASPGDYRPSTAAARADG